MATSKDCTACSSALGKRCFGGMLHSLLFAYKRLPVLSCLLPAFDRNGIDVDKLDYLQRDAMACGINSAKRDNFTRLFKLSKVCEVM